MEKAVAIISLLFLLLLGCKGNQEKTAENANEYSENPSEHLSGKPDTRSEALPDSAMAALKGYQYSWSDSGDMPPLVIVIDDFGQIGGELLDGFASLPKQVAFAILPDLPNTRETARLAEKNGHEVLIHIPMQAVGGDNPGKRYIKKGMETAEISDLLQDFYAQIPNAIAANNHMGSAVTADYATTYAVLDELKELGLKFLDSATTSKSAVPSAAANLGMKVGRRDIFLDVPDISDATLISKIQGLGKYKGRREPVVIITNCHNRNKLTALQKFLTQIDDMGLELIPPSRLFKSLELPA